MGSYDWHHRKLRERVAKHVATGTALCWRCGQPIHRGDPWDLGHSDAPGAKVRRLYNGPEHRRCSRSAGAWKRWGVHPPPVTRQVTARPRAQALEFFD